MKAKQEAPIEFHRDAMERFERAVKVVAKSPPQHRVKKKTKKGPGKPEPQPRSRQKINKNR